MNCTDRFHYDNILILKYCPACKHVWSLGKETEPQTV